MSSPNSKSPSPLSSSPSPSIRISSPLNPNPTPTPSPPAQRLRRASFSLRDESYSFSSFSSIPPPPSASSSPGQSSVDLPNPAGRARTDSNPSPVRGHSRSPLHSSLDLSRPRTLSNNLTPGHSPRISSLDLTRSSPHSRTHSPSRSLSSSLPPLPQGLPLEHGTYSSGSYNDPSHPQLRNFHVAGDETPPNAPPTRWWGGRRPFDPKDDGWGDDGWGSDEHKGDASHKEADGAEWDVAVDWERGWAEGRGFGAQPIPTKKSHSRNTSASSSRFASSPYLADDPADKQRAMSDPNPPGDEGIWALSLGVGTEERERAERREKGFFRRGEAFTKDVHAKDQDREAKGKAKAQEKEESKERASESWLSRRRASWTNAAGSGSNNGGGGAVAVAGAGAGAVSKVEEDQREGFERTRLHVALAVNSILSPAALSAMNVAKEVGHTASHAAHAALPVAKEALVLGTEVLRFAPLPGLEEAARTLLGIWQAMEMVDTNRLACLRLTERCATLLYSVRCEIEEAGDEVGEELVGPVGRLTSALHEVHAFLQRQLHRPFLKRYLRRDEIMREISACDRALGDVVGMFGISIQIRILKQVQAAAAESKKWAEEMQAHQTMFHFPATGNSLGLTLADGSLSPPPTYSLGGISPTSSDQGPTGGITPTPSNQGPSGMLTPTPSHPNLESSQITVRPAPSSSAQQQSQNPEQALEVYNPTHSQQQTQTLSPLSTLTHLHTTQNAVDSARDAAALRALLRDALTAGSDVELLRRMQVGRGEMPEAVRTLRRVLEGLEAGGGWEQDADGGGGGTLAVGGVGAAGGAGVAGGEGRERVVVPRRDTLDREFMESGIDAMTRLSSVAARKASIAGDEDAAVPWDLPSWTITRYEVDRTRKIGIGFFSDVYLGRWRAHAVAIKVLAPTTPRSIFTREVEIWRGLRHPNVLRLYGASSAAGERPWFFVSRYCVGGALVGWLKAAKERGGGRGEMMERGRSVRRAISGGSLGVGSAAGAEEVDLVRCMHQIAKGMEYLHGQGVLHGDLKAANVLVDETGRCVLSDFGQSEMKSEAYRLSGTPLPRGTLRWQAPELLEGDNRLTAAVDVYAFAICCVEILGMGDLPWALLDDTTVAHLVVDQDKRPSLPKTRCTAAVTTLIESCWARSPSARPTFKQIAASLKQIRKRLGSGGIEDSPLPPFSELWEQPEWATRTQASPDMRPGLLLGPGMSPQTEVLEENEEWDAATSSSPSDRFYETASEITPDSAEFGEDVHHVVDSSSSLSSHRLVPFRPVVPTHRHTHPGHGHSQDSGPMEMPMPVLYTPSRQSSMPSEGSGTGSSASSLFTSSPHESRADLHHHHHGVDYAGYDSPPPANERLAEGRNERRYRILARHTHEFHHSLTLPLWSPSHVSLGAVGYLSKPKGEFITLFNALDPYKTSGGKLKGMPSLRGYGDFNLEKQKTQNKRNVAQRGFLDALSGFLTFKLKGDGSYSESVSRRYSFPLRAGHKTAYICAETTMYRYVDNLDPAKKWFRHNVDAILQQYAPEHPIQKEDIFVVIGTLDAPDYALFVSHNHPDGQAHFNVYSPSKAGRAWGTFTTDSEFPSDEGGPSYHEEIPGKAVFASKISESSGGNVSSSKWDTLLLARLRFKPDIDEPTSL
ncbi:hypothetical protein BV22DRAFT_1098519 [Leucogyrophana mollusca]|uniref:Uncharacterized protein n=1 Tax=Leucogyrophana mollusca TaxID=85980 RepID=A0ACB8B3D9_9AGAM|nr:hypothetical protein BV22DRAFT_1098519 [Leucogyrophana mollusca]